MADGEDSDARGGPPPRGDAKAVEPAPAPDAEPAEPQRAEEGPGARVLTFAPVSRPLEELAAIERDGIFDMQTRDNRRLFTYSLCNDSRSEHQGLVIWWEPAQAISQFGPEYFLRSIARFCSDIQPGRNLFDGKVRILNNREDVERLRSYSPESLTETGQIPLEGMVSATIDIPYGQFGLQKGAVPHVTGMPPERGWGYMVVGLKVPELAMASQSPLYRNEPWSPLTDRLAIALKPENMASYAESVDDSRAFSRRLAQLYVETGAGRDLIRETGGIKQGELAEIFHWQLEKVAGSGFEPGEREGIKSLGEPERYDVEPGSRDSGDRAA